MIYCVDIDGTLCTNTDGAYENAKPRQGVITRVNTLYREGHRVILYTARGSTTGIDWKALTEQQLQAWGVRYHELRFGKPRADVFIDDRAVNVTVLEAAHQAPAGKAGRRPAVPRPSSSRSDGQRRSTRSCGSPRT